VRRPALIRLLAALALALAAAGCGSSGDGDDEEQASPIAAQAVVQEFSEVPGMPALESAVADPSWEQLGPGLDVSPATQKKYGTFTIYVVDPEDPQAVRSLLADKDTAKPLQADADGIYWDYDELAKSYVAQKRYGSNVVLAWWNESREQGTDERWQRLDAVMQDIASG
jgi:nitrous oxide reductase accessory protein NosL